jgi:hypothetical protein
MDLTDSCCSFEQSKKLRELGVNAESEFHWVLNSARENWRVVQAGSLRDFSFLPRYEAYSVAELLSILYHYSNREYVDLKERMAEYLANILITEIDDDQIDPKEIKL